MKRTTKKFTDDFVGKMLGTDYLAQGWVESDNVLQEDQAYARLEAVEIRHNSIWPTNVGWVTAVGTKTATAVFRREDGQYVELTKTL